MTHVLFLLFQHEIDETDQNVCSVQHCHVTRNLLSRWRQAAMDMINYPAHLPMELFACPENQRSGWIAELDLDPMMDGKISVCSLHFKDGRPTVKNPFPTERLNPLKDKEAPMFQATAEKVSFLARFKF